MSSERHFYSVLVWSLVASVVFLIGGIGIGVWLGSAKYRTIEDGSRSWQAVELVELSAEGERGLPLRMVKSTSGVYYKLEAGGEGSGLPRLVWRSMPNTDTDVDTIVIGSHVIQLTYSEDGGGVLACVDSNDQIVAQLTFSVLDGDLQVQQVGADGKVKDSGSIDHFAGKVIASIRIDRLITLWKEYGQLRSLLDPEVASTE